MRADCYNALMTKKRWLLVGSTLLFATVGVMAWWYLQYRQDTPEDGGMTEAAVSVMNVDRDTDTPEAAESSYRQQLQYKSEMADAVEGESIPYYANLISTASMAGLCDEAADLGRELEEINAESAFSQYSQVIKCYIAADQSNKAADLRVYIQDNLDKIPESRRGQFETEARS